MYGDFLRRNKLESQCCQVHPVTCYDLLVFFISLTSDFSDSIGPLVAVAVNPPCSLRGNCRIQEHYSFIQRTTKLPTCLWLIPLKFVLTYKNSINTCFKYNRQVHDPKLCECKYYVLCVSITCVQCDLEFVGSTSVDHN